MDVIGERNGGKMSRKISSEIDAISERMNYGIEEREIKRDRSVN